MELKEILESKEVDVRLFEKYLGNAIDNCKQSLSGDLTDVSTYNYFCSNVEDVKRWAQKVQTAKEVVKALEQVEK